MEPEASSPSSFRYEVRGKPARAVLLFMLVALPICVALALFVWPVALLLLASGIWNVVGEFRSRHRVLAAFWVESERLGWIPKSGDARTLFLSEIDEIRVHGGPESDLVFFVLRDGSTVTFDARRFGDTVKPISEYLYQHFPGRVIDLDNPRRARGSLAERLKHP